MRTLLLILSCVLPGLASVLPCLTFLLPSADSFLLVTILGSTTCRALQTQRAHMDRRNAFWILGASAAPLVAGVPEAAAASFSNRNPALISVRGEGTATAPPDTATITMGVSSEGKTAREALTKNNQEMEHIFQEMKNLGMQEKDLQTTSVRLHPNYNYKMEPPQVTGYRASNDLTIKIRDIETTGAVLDKAVSMGINNVMNNIQFSIEDPTQLLTQARKAAVQDARSKAQTIVDELGLMLGAVRSINEGTSGSAAPRAEGIQVRSMAASKSVPIASGENSYKVAVDISWEIDDPSGNSGSQSCEDRDRVDE